MFASPGHRSSARGPAPGARAPRSSGAGESSASRAQPDFRCTDSSRSSCGVPGNTRSSTPRRTSSFIDRSSEVRRRRRTAVRAGSRSRCSARRRAPRNRIRSPGTPGAPRRRRRLPAARRCPHRGCARGGAARRCLRDCARARARHRTAPRGARRRAAHPRGVHAGVSARSVSGCHEPLEIPGGDLELGGCGAARGPRMTTVTMTARDARLMHARDYRMRSACDSAGYLQQYRASRVPLTARRPRASTENARHSRSAAWPPSGAGVAVAMKDLAVGRERDRQQVFVRRAVRRQTEARRAARPRCWRCTRRAAGRMFPRRSADRASAVMASVRCTRSICWRNAGQRQRGNDADEDEHDQQFEQSEAAMNMLATSTRNRCRERDARNCPNAVHNRRRR